jgi:hypothetical protein
MATVDSLTLPTMMWPLGRICLWKVCCKRCLGTDMNVNVGIFVIHSRFVGNAPKRIKMYRSRVSKALQADGDSTLESNMIETALSGLGVNVDIGALLQRVQR